ncbi:MAG: BON domain-containing protein, partial [Burkholderiaceae bacterium]
MKQTPSLLRRTTHVAHAATPPHAPLPTDPEFEANARHAMHDGYAIRADRVHATLHEGRALITGNVQWQYQKDGATRCVEAMDGVTSVCNLLALQPDAPWLERTTS